MRFQSFEMKGWRQFGCSWAVSKIVLTLTTHWCKDKLIAAATSSTRTPLMQQTNSTQTIAITITCIWCKLLLHIWWATKPGCQLMCTSLISIQIPICLRIVFYLNCRQKVSLITRSLMQQTQLQPNVERSTKAKGWSAPLICRQSFWLPFCCHTFC